MYSIEVTNVSKNFGKVKALRDVSFTVDKGEVFGIIGPDGAGKTTLFRIMATLMKPHNGQVLVEGLHTIKQMREIRSIVGYMPGRFVLYQDMTVEENMNFFARLFHTTIEDGYGLVKDIYSQIEPFKTRRAKALSGGMKQKLALSCALIHRPKVLFLDEPTTGIDPISRKELWAMLAKLRNEGITVVVSTPYLDEVRRCDRIAFLDHGQLQGVGTPEEILTRFSSIFVPKRLEREASAVNSVLDAKPVIEVKEMTKMFGSFCAVDHISFSVKKGEIFGFLGANGAGKTTAMNILIGLHQPTSGKASVAGYDCSTQYELVKKRIGYMCQKFSLYEDMTVRENIRLYAGIYGMKDKQIREKTEQMLADLNFTEHGDDQVRSLPLGWRQRVAFLVSIFHEPSIVFLDEPTGGVDPLTRRQFWQLIYDAAARGITVFVTTHYMDEAEYCDRISIMVDGQIRAIGAPDELKQRYGFNDMDGVFTHLARQGKRTD